MQKPSIMDYVWFGDKYMFVVLDICYGSKKLLALTLRGKERFPYWDLSDSTFLKERR